MEPWIQTLVDSLIAVICGFIASGGFWTAMQKKFDRDDAEGKLILGLGHDRIMALGTKYIQRGWITPDEYENLDKYLYQPYKQRGGNGSAERIMKEVDKLPIRQDDPVL